MISFNFLFFFGGCTLTSQLFIVLMLSRVVSVVVNSLCFVIE